MQKLFTSLIPRSQNGSALARLLRRALPSGESGGSDALKPSYPEGLSRTTFGLRR